MNPILSAIAKASNSLQGKSFVDNESNPASALNMQKRRMQTAGTGTNSKNRALQSSINKTYGSNSKVQMFGSPLKK